jgi:nucleotide-binding universal stress UspA family protein
MKDTSEGLKKIIWAVDLLSDTRVLQASALKTVERLTSRSNAKVYPVYVFKVPADVSFDYRQELVSEARQLANEGFQELIRRSPSSNIFPPVIIDEPFQALRRGADLLVKYAKDQAADLIVVNTHLKREPLCGLMGSFSEGLALNSEVPVLSVSPYMKNVDVFQHILYATDFSEESKEAFDQVLGFALELGSDITLFHKLGPQVGPKLSKFVRVQSEHLKRTGEEARLIGESWVNQGREKGVTVKLVFESEVNRSPADVILEEVNQNPAIVALVGKSGPFSSLLLGSTTRNVMKGCQKPVLILHSSKIRRLTESQQPLFQISEQDVMSGLENQDRRRKAAS